MNESFWQAQGRFLERLTGRVGVGDAAQQPLDGPRAAQALQVTHQGQGAIPLATPTQGLTRFKLDPKLHRLGLLEPAQLPTPDGLKPETLETGGQEVGIAQHRWQDGEVGHGANARFSRR